MIYLTTGTATLPLAYGIEVQVNAAIASGTLTVKDAGTTMGVITNPTVGLRFRFVGFTGVPTVVASTTVDVTINLLNRTV